MNKHTYANPESRSVLTEFASLAASWGHGGAHRARIEKEAAALCELYELPGAVAFPACDSVTLVFKAFDADRIARVVVIRADLFSGHQIVPVGDKGSYLSDRFGTAMCEQVIRTGDPAAPYARAEVTSEAKALRLIQSVASEALLDCETAEEFREALETCERVADVWDVGTLLEDGFPESEWDALVAFKTAREMADNLTAVIAPEGAATVDVPADRLATLRLVLSGKVLP